MHTGTWRQATEWLDETTGFWIRNPSDNHGSGMHGMACCLAMEMFLYQGGGYPLRFLGDGIALHAFESFGLVCAIDSNYY